MALLVPLTTPSSSTTVFPPPVGTSSSTSSAVAAVAKNRLSPEGSPTTPRLRADPARNPPQEHYQQQVRPTSPMTTRLISAGPARDLLQEKYQEARRLLSIYKPDNARALFAEIIEELPSTEDNRHFLAHCKIGFGYTYPEGSTERQQAAMDAKVDLDWLYNERSSWVDLPIDQNIDRYRKMKMLLVEFQVLIPEAEASFKTDIESKIEECNLHISPLSNFYDKLAQGIRFFKDDKRDQARNLFTEALAMIEGRSEPDYLLAQALGAMNLAFTFPSGEAFKQSSSAAVLRAFLAYEQREELLTNEKTKAVDLMLFCELWNKLRQLIPEDQPLHPQIMKKLEECEKQLVSLQQAEKPDSKKTPPGPKVTPTLMNDS